MKNHEGGKRAYIRSSKAHYASVLKEKISVMIGIYYAEGGTSGEFEVEFIELGKGKQLAARLKAFEDSWNALWLFKDLLEKMAEVDEQEIQEPEFCKLLDSLGIIDITEYERGVPKNAL
jgi:hypothetical protein